jgi:tetratricopeptide (TPR) repeat protein
MQDEIAVAVVRALKLKLAPSRHSFIPRSTVDADAYNEYLLGQQLLNRANDPVGYRRAADAFHKAIKSDATFAAPYAGLTYAEAMLADQTDDAPGLKRAEADADRAVALAPDSADGYAARGYLRFGWMWDWAGAQADFENALALDGGDDSTVQRHYGQLLGSLGRVPEAIAAAKKSTELDPLADAAWLALGRYLMADRQFAAAHEALRRALEIQPEDSFVLHDLGMLQLLEGNLQAASTTFGLVPSEGVHLMGVAMTEHSLGHGSESRQALDQLIAEKGQAWAYQIAEVYAWRGEKNKAFEWLQRGYDRHDGGHCNIKIDALLFSLRGDARFGAMLRKMKLPA